MLILGLFTAGISPTKTGGAYMMTGWAFFQFLLSGKYIVLSVIILNISVGEIIIRYIVS